MAGDQKENMKKIENKKRCYANKSEESLKKDSDIYTKISHIAMRFAIVIFVLEIVFSYCYSLLFQADDFAVGNFVTNVMMFVVVILVGSFFVSSIVGYLKRETRFSKETLIVSVALIVGIGGGLLAFAWTICSVLISFR